MNIDEITKIVAISIGLAEDDKVESDWEWDSLDHLSIVMNLQTRGNVDLKAVGDLSDINSIAKLKKRFDEVENK